MRRILVAIVLAGCGGDATNADAPQRPVTFGGDRPVDLEVPVGFDPEHSYPLIVVLHGYGANGFVQEAVFGVKTEVTSGRAFVLAPWSDVDPDATLLDRGPVAELLEKVADQVVTRRDDLSLNLQ